MPQNGAGPMPANTFEPRNFSIGEGDGAPGPVTKRLSDLFADLTARTGTVLT